MSSQWVLVLGATGASGQAFVEYVRSLPQPPKLSLLVRNAAKLASDVSADPNVKVIEAPMTDTAAIDSAMQGVTAVVSFLGAYTSLYYFLTRSTPTPIADSLRCITSAMKAHNVKRILALSTPAHPVEGESYTWAQYIGTRVIPPTIIPQGSAEMTAIAKVCADPALDFTIFRVPLLTDGPVDLPVFAGMIGPDYKGTMKLSRKSMAKWVYGEIGGRQWVGKEPALGNR